MVAIAGNHDHVAAGVSDGSESNDAVKTAAVWPSTQLSVEHRAFLGSLPFVLIEGPFTLVHGSLRNPIVEYLLDRNSAVAALNLMETEYCLVGHSLIPFVCCEVLGNSSGAEFIEFTEAEPMELGSGRLIINPGGVGQPRDRNPQPSYAIYDSDSELIYRHRVNYDISKTQEKMKAANLPSALIERLSHGL